MFTHCQIGFLVLTLIGVSLAPLMADPKRVIRTDGTKVTLPRQPSWKIEFYSLYVALKTDPMIILLFPMFVASNYFYTWRKHSISTLTCYDKLSAVKITRAKRLQRRTFQHSHA